MVLNKIESPFHDEGTDVRYLKRFNSHNLHFMRLDGGSRQAAIR